MKTITFLLIVVAILSGCNNDNSQKKKMQTQVKVVFLHHSTGNVIWKGNTSRIMYKLLGKGDVNKCFDRYNRSNHTSYKIEDIFFPKEKPYGWKNYPFDYYNIWVKHQGNAPFMGEPTLEMLTKKYQVIVWKHCFPVSDILPDTGKPDVNSEEKRIENYKLQYMSLKEKMRSFPQTKFIVWTGAALTRGSTTKENAKRAKEFFTWVKSEWDEPGDNIFIWDFNQLETEGGLYFKDEYSVDGTNSHPSSAFGAKIAPLFTKRIIDVIEGRGDKTPVTGSYASEIKQ